MFKRRLEKQYMENDVIDEVWARNSDGVLVKVEPEEDEETTSSGTACAAPPSPEGKAQGVTACC